MNWCEFFALSFICFTVQGHVAKHPKDILVETKKHHHGALSEEIEDPVLEKHHLPKSISPKKSQTEDDPKDNHEITEAKCVPFMSCPAHVRMEEKKLCQVNKKTTGVMCRTGRNHSEIQLEKSRGHDFVHLDLHTLDLIKTKTKSELSKLRSRESELLKSRCRTILEPGPASYSHYRNSRPFDKVDLSDVMNIANDALEIAIATRAFKDRHGVSNEQLELGMVNQDLRNTPLGHSCVELPFCPPRPDRFRRIDGACNNEYHSTWGAPMTPYSRLLPAYYKDGIWAPRSSQYDESSLPSPRLVSTTVISDADSYNHEYTMLLMQFGQFLSHDITQQMDATFNNGSGISCCSEDGTDFLPVEETHYACMPISIPEDDPFFKGYEQKCMNFVRSMLSPREDCTLGYSQQMNKITHFLDMSSVYGSTPEQTRELRSFEGGKLKTFTDFGRQLLPLSKDPNACLTMEQGSACFESGDTRTNQMISLVVLHTLFFREHNRLADILYELNPHWHDEKIFLEARNILIAEWQVIVYNEFIPALIGEEGVDEFNLHLTPEDQYSYDYDAEVEPSVTNEFAAAALRFGHSIVDGTLKMYGRTKMEEQISIPDVMFYPAKLRYTEFMDEMLSTLTTEPIQEVDSFMSDALTKYMFRAGNPFGVDLASINIQRGRDHGLRPYNDYRELAGLPRIKEFSEFGIDMGEKLAKVYNSVDDIDLWVGGLLEAKYPGCIVGPTFRGIIGDQFSRLKRGDKYFFENSPDINPGHFEPVQLKELKKASIARIICDNNDNVLLSRQAPNAFRKPGVPGNEFADCSGPEIPKIDLTLWQE